MSNTLKISITIPAEVDAQKLGEAIAQLIRAVTPEEEWAEIAQQMKFQASEQIAQIQTRNSPPEEPQKDA
jgi:hypothetical protein